MADNNFSRNGQEAIGAIADYLAQSRAGDLPVIDQQECGSLMEKLDLAPLVREGGLDGVRLEKFIGDYLAMTTRLHHPHYMAHQVAVPHPTGALGSLIDGVTNNAMAIYEMGPAASAIEFFMLNWMLEKVGWTAAPLPRDQKEGMDFGGGVLTHGGSLANLTALLAARSARFPDFWKEGKTADMVVLVPEQSHYSLKRSVAILGLGENACIPLPADEDGRVKPSAIPPLLQRLKKEGREVMALVGNACGTAAGLFDPLEELGALCRAEKIWFHVDGAHGAGVLLSDKLRPLMKGVELADSMIWDAHKMMRVPVLCAAVLVKDYRHLDRAFSQEASYLFHEKDQPGYDFMPRTVECTKSGLGLKMFMTVAAQGEQGVGDYVEGRVELAQRAASLMEDQADFEVAVAPEINILCFRYAEKNDAFQLDIRKQLLKRGIYYITTTDYRGRRWLRLVLMNPDTTLDHISGLIDEIREIAQILPA